MKNYTETQKLVYKMLTTNTGVHMCDSGGENGRMWQRNESKSIDDFNNEEEQTVTIDNDGYLEHTVSVFHYLSQLELDDVCREFNKINSNSDNWDADAGYYGISTEAWDYLEDNFEDIKTYNAWNTYNWDCPLSQTLQGGTIEIDGGSYAFIQIHNGADVRGGYTDTMLFKLSGYGESIHEYLPDYSDEYEIINDIKEGYVTARDEDGNDLTVEQATKLLDRNN